MSTNAAASMLARASMSGPKNESGGGGCKSKRPAPLKVVKDDFRQFRAPVIIHTFSPKIIHTDPAHFSTLVQQLTGRGHKRKTECLPAVVEATCSSSSSSAQEVSSAPPPSSASEAVHACGVSESVSEAVESKGGFSSPRGPLLAFEASYTFDSCTAGPEQSMNGYSISSFSLPHLPYSQLGYSSPKQAHFYSPLPSPSFLSTSFISDLPHLSPGASYQTFDAHCLAAYGRQFSGSLPSPGSNILFKDLPSYLTGM